nr:hypothetical protein [Scytonema sp. UIC 10036]
MERIIIISSFIRQESTGRISNAWVQAGQFADISDESFDLLHA